MGHRDSMADDRDSEDLWRDKLTPEQFEILRNKGTEAPHPDAPTSRSLVLFQI